MSSPTSTETSTPRQRTRNCKALPYHKWNPQHIEWMIKGHTRYDDWEDVKAYMNGKARRRGQGEPFKTPMIKAYWRFLRKKQEKEEEDEAAANSNGAEDEEDAFDDDATIDGEMGLDMEGVTYGEGRDARVGYKEGNTNATNGQGMEIAFLLNNVPETRRDLDAVFIRETLDGRHEEQRAEKRPTEQQRYEQQRHEEQRAEMQRAEMQRIELRRTEQYQQEQQANFEYKKGMNWRPGMTWNGNLISKDDFEVAQILMDMSAGHLNSEDDFEAAQILMDMSAA